MFIKTWNIVILFSVFIFAKMAKSKFCKEKNMKKWNRVKSFKWTRKQLNRLVDSRIVPQSGAIFWIFINCHFADDMKESLSMSCSKLWWVDETMETGRRSCVNSLGLNIADFSLFNSISGRKRKRECHSYFIKLFRTAFGDHDLKENTFGKIAAKLGQHYFSVLAYFLQEI